MSVYGPVLSHVLRMHSLCERRGQWSGKGALRAFVTSRACLQTYCCTAGADGSCRLPRHKRLCDIVRDDWRVESWSRLVECPVTCIITAVPLGMLPWGGLAWRGLKSRLTTDCRTGIRMCALCNGFRYISDMRCWTVSIVGQYII